MGRQSNSTSGLLRLELTANNSAIQDLRKISKDIEKIMAYIAYRWKSNVEFISSLFQASSWKCQHIDVNFLVAKLQQMQHLCANWHIFDLAKWLPHIAGPNSIWSCTPKKGKLQQHFLFYKSEPLANEGVYIVK